MAARHTPHLDLGVLEALGHEVDGLVGLVLVGLYARLLGLERAALWFVGQSVLQDKGEAHFIDGARFRQTIETQRRWQSL